MNPFTSRDRGIALHRGSRALMSAVVILLASAPPGSLEAQLRQGAVSRDSIAALRGVVQEYETGSSLPGAAVSLASGPGGTLGIGTRVTDSEGRFFFRRVPPGTYRLIVTLIGYRDVRDTLEVAPGSDLDLILPMSVSPIPMEPIVVEAERPLVGPMRDFQRRRETFAGYFFDREDIEARHPLVFTDLLRWVPGVRVIPVSPYDNAVRLRAGCTPVLWLDGMRLMTVDGVDHLLSTMDLEAVEVYNSPTLPVEFGANPCGAIVAWTRRGERVEGEGSLWRRLAVALGFLTLGFLLTR